MVRIVFVVGRLPTSTYSSLSDRVSPYMSDFVVVLVVAVIAYM